MSKKTIKLADKKVIHPIPQQPTAQSPKALAELSQEDLANCNGGIIVEDQVLF